MMASLTEARRLLDRRVVIPVLVGLTLLVAYQVYAYRQHASAVQAKNTATAVAKTRTAATCPQVARLYATLLQLMANDGTFTAGQTEVMRAQGVSRVAACHAAS